MSPAVFGLGPLERWLGDHDVSEVLVNGGTEVWIERRGAVPGMPVGPQFAGLLDDGVLDTVIERILGPIGRRLDRTTPIVDARLPDGSRVCAVVPPVAVDGPCLAIRRFHAHEVDLSAFTGDEVAAVLVDAIRDRANVLVSGATSAGKTTLLNVLARQVDPCERIVTLEDTAELRLGVPHVVRLETRPPTSDGLAGVTMADLLRAALRLRPDRLVIGEIRGDEAIDLVQALNTGHDGSLSTLHANSAADALARLSSLVVRAAPGWSLPAVREQVHRSIDLVVHVARAHDGRRRIDHVAEVVDAGDRERPGAHPAEGHPVRMIASGGRVVGRRERRPR